MDNVVTLDTKCWKPRASRVHATVDIEGADKLLSMGNAVGIMTLSIKNPEADTLARELAQATGETITEAVKVALRERLARIRRLGTPGLADELNRIAEHCASLPVLDPRAPDEILGYNEYGHFD